MNESSFEVIQLALELIKPTALTAAMQPDEKWDGKIPAGNRCELCAMFQDNGKCQLLNDTQQKKQVYKDEATRQAMVGLTQYGYCKEFRFSLPDALVRAAYLLQAGDFAIGRTEW